MRKGRGHCLSAPLPSGFWSEAPTTMTAERDLERVLGSVTRLPLLYWKERMFFHGLPDRTALALSEGRFPAGPVRGTHPVFCLRAQPQAVGFKVCPCSSKRPYRTPRVRYICKGCRLQYTGNLLDRNSYLVEDIQFNIPRSMAAELRFWGLVPEECIARDG